jgi:hypothetical protein
MTKNVIFRGSAEINKPILDEAVLVAAIAPGSLMIKDATGKFAVHATANGGSEEQLYILDANTLLQLPVTTNVALGDTGQGFEPRPGERYNMLVATGQTIDVLDKPLTSAGNGLLDIGTPATEDILCYADEIITTTATTLVAVKFK